MIASQSWVNPYLGIDGVCLLRKGNDAGEVLKEVLRRDPRPELRQVGLVDTDGVAAAYTGVECIGWAGHRTGSGYSVQGNMLVGQGTVAELENAFVASGSESLPERLVLALEDGQRAGGDKRGRQSAALRVYAGEEYPIIDLRIDDNPDPVTALRRIWDVAQTRLVP